MAAQKGTPSLAQFAADSSRAPIKWCDRLPVDVQEQLIETDCSAAVAVDWLLSLGHEGATQNKIQNWRKAKRDERRRAG
jgi:hypothetical protein